MSRRPVVLTGSSLKHSPLGGSHLAAGGGARRWLVLGVGGSALIALALALLMSVVAPPFSAGDENEHVSYALEVGHGRLPTLATQVRPEIPRMRHDDIYTANHPPLFYVLEAVPLLVGTRTGHPVLGLHLARALNALIGATGVVALAVLARVVVPRRPDVAFAAALLAPVPLLVAVSGQVYNDALAVATSTGALAAAATVLLRGPSRGRLALLAGAALLATATRATGGEPAALAVLAAAVAVLVHATSSGWRRVGSAAAAAAAVAVPVLLGVGWFFERNRRLYGDPTGSRQALRRFPDQRVPVLHSASSVTFWLHQYTGMFGRAQFFSGALRFTAYAVGVVLAVGALLAVGAVLSALLLGGRDGRRPRRSPPTKAVAVIALLAAHLLATGAIVLVYLSQGGIPYPRYLLAAVPVLALLVSYGYAVSSRYGILFAGTPCLLALVGLALVVGSHGNAFSQPPGLSTALRLSAAVHASGVPHSGLVLSAVALVLAAAVALVLAAFVALRPQLLADRATGTPA